MAVTNQYLLDVCEQGPYIIYVEKMEMCERDHGASSTYIRVSHFKPAKPYQKQTLTGNITAINDFNDTFWVSYVSLRINFRSAGGNEIVKYGFNLT